MEIAIISIDSVHPLFSEWMDLRQRVLREPLGLRYTSSDLAEEAEDHHRVASMDGRVVGGLLIRKWGMEEGAWKIRQVAVEPAKQSCGIGRCLVSEAIAEAKRHEVLRLVLHSREAVCGFYETLGFAIVGDPFEEIGISHRRMIRDISTA